MTVRLLCAHDKYPANAVVKLDAGTEAGLIAAGIASSTLTGGTPYVESAPIEDRGRIVLFGDSITNQNHQSSATFSATLAKGYWTHAAAMLEQPFDVTINSGISGNTTGQMRDRLGADVLAHNPEYCFFLGGTNDVGADVPYATTVDNYTEIFDRIRAAGVTLIIATMTPRGFAGITQAKLSNMMNLNTWLQNYAARNSVPLVDLYRQMMDYSDLTSTSQGNPVAAWFDGALLHPLAAGAVQMGSTIYRQLDKQITRLPRRLHCNYNGTAGDASNLIRNGMFVQGTGGTLGANASGTLAQNWTAAAVGGGSIAGACSIVQRSASFNDGFPGIAQRVAISGAGATSEIFRLTPSVPIGPTPGDQVCMEVEVMASASTGTINEISILWGTVGSPVISCAGNYMPSASETMAIGTAVYRGVIRTPPMTIPASAVGAYANINIRTSAGAVAQLDFANARFSKVLQP